jgi:hypothetical protein
MSKGDPQILFSFSPELDTDFLRELYVDDFRQAELVFESSLQQLRSEFSLARARFHDGDITGLKKVIHKVKPIFGYVGMNKVQEEYKDFEESCVNARSAADIESGFGLIIGITEQAIQKMETELKRLKQYNTQFL